MTSALDGRVILRSERVIADEASDIIGNWEGRYVAIKKKANYFHKSFIVLDTYHNLSREIEFQFGTNERVFSFTPLTGRHLLICTGYALSNSIHLAYVDFHAGELIVIGKIGKTIPRREFVQSYVDQFDKSKFCIMWYHERELTVSVYVLSNGIVKTIRKVLLRGADRGFSIDGYSNDKLFAFRFENNQIGNMINANVFILELNGRFASRTLPLAQLPDHILPWVRLGQYKWFNDYLFVSTWSHRSNSGVVAFTSFPSCNWTFLELHTSSPIVSISFDKTSMLAFIESEDNVESEEIYSTGIYEVHKMPIRKPTPLEEKAWFGALRSFAHLGFEASYNLARRFLPLISKLHSPFVDSTEE